MENNFLLYFFAFAFLIAWSVVVVCSAYSFIRSVKKDIENHYLQINKRGVEYDDKPAYLAISKGLEYLHQEPVGTLQQASFPELLLLLRTMVP